MKNDIANSAFVQFEVWDFPGHVDTSSDAVKPETTYGGCGALVWVIDAQDDHNEAIQRLASTIVTAHRINPNMVFEVFVHKVDSLSDDQRIECQREIQNQLNDELATARVSHAKVSFHLTSIYDHSVFEAFSKVVQQLSFLPSAANPHVAARRARQLMPPRIDKAFLFDVVSKIYVATDSSPVDMQSYELCADMIDAVIDVSSIYGLTDEGASGEPAPESNCVITLSSQRQDDGTVISARAKPLARPRLHPLRERARAAGAARVQLRLLPRVALRALQPAVKCACSLVATSASRATF